VQAKGGAGVEQETITYYPGDPMVLEVQIEHKPNFRRVEAVFRGRPDREGESPFSGRLVAHEAQVLTEEITEEMRPDGTKLSTVRFESTASRNDWVPEQTYELVELGARTVGGMPVVLDISGIAKPRFRLEEEGKELTATVRSAELLR
jgi:hypothetical protein